MNKIIHGDCLEVMPTLPDKSIDMILCDLPYGTTACKWDMIIPFVPLWEEYKRLIKDNGAIVLTASQPFTTILIQSNVGMFRYNLVWDKKFAGNFANCNRQPLKTHEDIVVFYLKQPNYNPQMVLREKPIKTGKIATNPIMKDKTFKNTKKVYTEKYPTSILTFPRQIGRAIHSTQKPVALFEYLIKTYTNEGETVLDNCAGSGTTAIACLNTNRNYILIEKEKEYIDVINKRIAEHEQQISFV